MPYLPKWMADSLENLLPSKFFDAEVMATEFINQEILQITFRGNFINIEFYPGWAVMLRIGPNDLRHYTISYLSRETGLFKIIFHIHSSAPGCDFVSLLKVGESLKMAVPGGRKMFVSSRDKHFFFGDETSLSFTSILIEEIWKNCGSYHGIIELRVQNSEVPAKLNMIVKTVASTPDRPGRQAINYLKELKEKSNFSFEGYIFYLTGNVTSIHAFRGELKKLGINSQNIKFQGYWVEGSVGL